MANKDIAIKVWAGTQIIKPISSPHTDLPNLLRWSQAHWRPCLQSPYIGCLFQISLSKAAGKTDHLEREGRGQQTSVAALPKMGVRKDGWWLPNLVTWSKGKCRLRWNQFHLPRHPSATSARTLHLACSRKVLLAEDGALWWSQCPSHSKRGVVGIWHLVE